MKGRRIIERALTIKVHNWRNKASIREIYQQPVVTLVTSFAGNIIEQMHFMFAARNIFF
jgi:hypothetical protein